MQQEKPVNISYMIGSAEAALELEWSAWTQGMLKKKEVKPEDGGDDKDDDDGIGSSSSSNDTGINAKTKEH